MNIFGFYVLTTNKQQDERTRRDHEKNSENKQSLKKIDLKNLADTRNLNYCRFFIATNGMTQLRDWIKIVQNGFH